MLFCGAAPLNNSGSREKIKTCSYCTRYLFSTATVISEVAREKRLLQHQFRITYLVQVCYSVVQVGSQIKTCSYCTRYVILWCCSSQFRDNSGSREKIETCSYCTRYVILWCCSSQFRNNSGSREKIETCSYCTRYVILWCCSSQSLNNSGSRKD